MITPKVLEGMIKDVEKEKNEIMKRSPDHVGIHYNLERLKQGYFNRKDLRIGTHLYNTNTCQPESEFGFSNDNDH